MESKIFFRITVFVSVLAVIFLPVYAMLVLYPSMTDMLTGITEKEAVRIAGHLASSVVRAEGGSLKAPEASAEAVQEMEKIAKDVGLVKIKLFAPSGKIIFSTDRQEIGEMNRKEYFHTIVAGGQTYTMVVKKNRKTLEDKVISADVVETYVPIMQNGTFLGAFEIYYDITESTQKTAVLVFKSSVTIILVAAGLLLAVIAASLGAKRHMEERQRMAQALALSERKYRDLYDNAPDMYYSLDREGIIIDCNEPTALMLGHAREEIIGRSVREFFTEGSKALFDQFFPRLVKEKGDYLLEREFVRKDGTVFPAGLHVFSWFDDQGKVVVIRTIARDITSEKVVEDQLRQLAERDSLTGIYNRRMFFNFIETEANRAMRHERNLALIMFDIDHFKQVNDTFGHDAGDDVLTGIVDVLKEEIRKTDILARYGGEEFLVLLPETDAAGAMALAEKIRVVVEAIRHDKVDRPVTISLGITVFSGKEDSVDGFLKRADDALYKAKNGGRNRCEFLA